MSIIYKTGNIFTSEAPIIGHGVNAEGAMGSGIAVQFKQRYPKMHTFYKNLCATTTQPEQLAGQVAMWVEDFYTGQDPYIVANIFSQVKMGANAKYEWAFEGIKSSIIFAEVNGHDTIALPQIGCGVGGLDWPVMSRSIERYFSQAPVDIELWTYA